MFKTLKEKLQICDVVSKYTEEDIKLIGESATVESDVCPFCSHKDCFRIKLESDDEDGFFNCFSCGEHGDLVTFVQSLKGLDSPVEAAKLLSKDFDIPLPINSNPMQDIFTLAARYYRTCLEETLDKVPELGGLTPLEYQTKTRGHSASTLETLQIGWSDGGLATFLKGIGIDQSLLDESGLLNKVGKDFLPTKSFIYPHFVKGRVSHFTFKDPLKKVSYQLKNSSKLNGHQWYNQDALGLSDTLILVEGENDLASIMDSGARNVIASIGQLSTGQIEWLIANYEGKDLITLFDPDSAGDKYREKIHKARRKFRRVKQICLEGDKDIDERLRSGDNLKEIIDSWVEKEPEEQAITPVSSSTFGYAKEATDDEAESLVRDDSDLSVRENKGCYVKIKEKEGVPYFIRISNFVIRLNNIFISGSRRVREVVIIRSDGEISEPREVSSETKTSLKSFRTFLADAKDASFTGSEADLADMWEYVYRHNAENEVHMLDYVGLTPHGWICNKKMITPSSKVVEADETGTFWPQGRNSKKAKGIKPMSLETGDNACKRDLPEIDTILTREQNQELLEGFVINLARNLGCPGKALLIIGWLRAVANSEWFYNLQGHFPHLWIIGRSNAGKTTINSWLLRTYGMEDKGIFNISSMKTPVAAERKIAYYASLPICIDEMRVDERLTQYQTTFRSWYDRRGRDVGTNEDSRSIKKQRVRACVFYSGQDSTNDTGLMERLLLIEVLDHSIKANNREIKETYNWINDKFNLLPSLGYYWIQESTCIDQEKLRRDLRECCEVITTTTPVVYRYAVNYALAKIMADEYAKKLFPDFKWEEYIVNMAKKSQTESDQEDVIHKFFEIAESLTMGNNPRITPDHYRVTEGVLYIHYPSIFTEVSKDIGRSKAMSETFSQQTVERRFCEQEWFIGKGIKKCLGVKSDQKRTIAIDLSKAPEYIRTFAKYSLEGETK